MSRGEFRVAKKENGNPEDASAKVLSRSGINAISNLCRDVSQEFQSLISRKFVAEAISDPPNLPF